MRQNLNIIRRRRKKRARAKILGTSQRPRLTAFRSNRQSYAQLIDDLKGHTLVSASTQEIKKLKSQGAGEKNKKVALAKALGELIAQKALKKNIKKAVFDRGAYNYHGRVRAIAEGAREGGLQF